MLLIIECFPQILIPLLLVVNICEAWRPSKPGPQDKKALQGFKEGVCPTRVMNSPIVADQRNGGCAKLAVRVLEG